MSSRAARPPSLLPFWFRALTAGAFAALLAGFWVARGSTDAVADALDELVGAPAAPVIRAGARLGDSGTQPGRGHYRLNGMPVRFDTFGAPGGAGPKLIEIETALARAGYEHRILLIDGLPTVVGLHPESLVLITARPGRDLRGAPAVRIAEHRLAELDPRFEAEIPDVARYPGAAGAALVEARDGSGSMTLLYTARGTFEDVARYYGEEMHRLGWKRIDAPAGSLGGVLSIAVFRRDGVECTVLLVDAEDGSGTQVMASVDRHPLGAAEAEGDTAGLGSAGRLEDGRGARDA